MIQYVCVTLASYPGILMLHLPVLGVFRGILVTVEEERDSEEVRISDDDTQILLRVILLKC